MATLESRLSALEQRGTDNLRTIEIVRTTQDGVEYSTLVQLPLTPKAPTRDILIERSYGKPLIQPAQSITA